MKKLLKGGEDTAPMNLRRIEEILASIKDGSLDIDRGVELLRRLPYDDLGFAKIDNHRELRRGEPEAIYCPGKSDEQIRAIMERNIAEGASVFASRATRENYKAVKDLGVEFFEGARIIFHGERREKIGMVAVVTGGTSDQPVAEEAAVALEIMGNNVLRIYDVGIAGIHRLLKHLDEIKEANAIVCIAGMEGALPGVLAGLVDIPVIAVPTSVGYGASFSGLTALLGMLSTCSPGVAVVNIDNGYGAAYFASGINRRIAGGKE